MGINFDEVTTVTTTGLRTRSKPARFKFVEPYCITAKDGQPTRLGFIPDSKVTQEDPFIISTPTAIKTDPNVRRFIRSHVMRGKNKKNPDGSRVSASTPTPTQRQRPADLGRQSPPRTPDMDSFSLRHRSFTTAHGSSAGSSTSTERGTRQVVYSPWLPKPIGPDLAFVRFAEPLPQAKVNMLITAINHWKEHMYPLSMCVNFQDCDKWIEYFSRDRAYVNSILFAAKCMEEAMKNRGPGRESTVYLSKTLKFLQNNLNDKNMATTDTSIAVVVILILTACGMGDIDEVGHHIGGMKHMIKLRGGVAQLAHTEMVQMKACRVDLSYALERGEDPTLFTPEEIEGFWNRTSIATELRQANNLCPKVKGFRKHDNKAREWRWSANPIGNLARGAAIIPALCDSIPSHLLPHSNFIGRLQSIFDDLHEFSSACNLALRTGDKLSSGQFRDVLISTQYRLSRLEAQYTQGLKDGTILESAPLELDIVRIGMLVFGTVTFLHAEAVVFHYSHVAEKVRACLQAMSSVLPGLLQRHSMLAVQDPQSADARASLQRLHLFLWFLFVVHFSTFVNPDNEDLLVSLVSGILIATGIKSVHGGTGPAIQSAGLLPRYNSPLFSMYPVANDAPSPSVTVFADTTSSSIPPTFSAPSGRSNSPTELGLSSFQPEYSYPPPSSSPSSADDWQPHTPPEQPTATAYSPFDPQGSRTSESLTTIPNFSCAQSPSDQSLHSLTTSVGGSEDDKPRYHLPSSLNGDDGTVAGIERVDNNSSNVSSKPIDGPLGDYASESIRLYKGHISTSVNTHAWNESRDMDDPPLLYIWDILKDHLWVDWVHRASGKVLTYKAFALG